MGVIQLPPRMLFVYAASGGAFHHLGAGYIQAYLKRQGISSRQFIFSAETNLDGLIEQIQAVGAGIIGFTCYDKNYYLSKIIAQRLKHLHPEPVIMFGGPTPSFLDRLIMRDCPAIDICVRGEGEHTVGELLKRLPDKDGLESIPGITFRKEGRLISTAPRTPDCGLNQAEALNIFPSPYLEEIIPPEFITSVGLSSSRGCPYNCTYCNFSAVSGKTVRYHSSDRIISELKYIENVLCSRLSKGQRQRLAINDDIFTFNIERAKHICRLIIKERFNHLEFIAETRADKVDEELLQLLYTAGFKEINFGLESAVPRVLSIVKKVGEKASLKNNFRLEEEFIAKLKKRVHQAKKIGLNPTVSIICGLPGEKPAEAKQTIECVRKLKVGNYFHNVLNIYAGTELFRTHPRYGLRLKKSATTLPFNLQPAYDVNRIPVIDERHTCFKYGVVAEETNTQHALRLWGIDLKRRVFLKDMLLMEHEVMDAEIIDWLTTYMPLSTRLCIWDKQGKGFDYQKSINRFTKSQALVPEINHLTLHPSSQLSSRPADISRYVWAFRLSDDGFYPPHLHNFYPASLKDFDRLWGNMPQTPVNKGIFLFSLDSKADIAAFTKLIMQLEAGPTKFPSAFMDYRIGIIDECRFAADECPAPGLPKLVIKGQKITPCINGQVVGNVGDDPLLVRDRLSAIKKKTAQKRGCEQCPVQDTCSCCLFPYPLSDVEYCNFKRERPQLSEVMRFLSYLRKVFLYRHLPPIAFADIFPHTSPEIIIEMERFIKAYELYHNAQNFN